MRAPHRAFVPAFLSLALAAPDLAAQCEKQKIVPSDGGAFDDYASAVATDGQRVIVGAVFHDSPIQGADTGKAYIYELSGSTWVETGALEASDITLQDRYAFTVDIEGTLAVVGARYNDDVGYGSGSAYIYEKQQAGWTEIAKLRAGDEALGDLYGNHVAISGDTVLIGAIGGKINGLKSGTTYVYVRSGSTWNEIQEFTASDQQGGMAFGGSLEIEGDRAIVSARNNNAGAVYVFERPAPGALFTETKKLSPSDGQPGDFFGTALALQGDRILIGAPGKTNATGSFAGSAYIYELVGGNWVETKLNHPDVVADDFYGASVGLSGDTAIVGSWGHDSVATEAGAMYMFQKGPMGWVPTAKLTVSDFGISDNLGYAAAFGGDLAFFGARHADNGQNVSTGAAYAFTNLGAFRPVVAGCPGTGGITPQLSFKGCPAPGGSLTMNIDHALGGAPALLLVGGQPASLKVVGSCFLGMSPLLQAQAFAFTGTGPGAGSLSVTGTVPAATGSIMVQAYVADPAGPIGIVLTNAVELVVE